MLGTVRVTVDLDGDDQTEHVSLGTGRGGILISDGTVSYRSRAKWRVIQATVGDSDRDGLPEVVALVEEEAGRRLALIGWHAGRYQERLVTSLLRPRPVGITIRVRPEYGGAVVVIEEGPGASGDGATTTYRWNGFGFTAVAGVGAGR